MHLEKWTRRDVVIPVGLLVEFTPIARHWCVNLGNLVHVHHFHDVVDVRDKVADGVVRFVDNLFGQLLRHEVVHKVEAHVFLQKVDHVESKDFAKQIFGPLVLARLIRFPCTLKEESLTECRGKCLNIIIAFEHPDVVELSFLLHNLCLHDLCESLNLKRLLHQDQIFHGLQVQVLRLLELRKSFFIEVRCIMSFLLGVLEDILDHFLHENAIVTLSSHSTVRLKDNIW